MGIIRDTRITFGTKGGGEKKKYYKRNLNKIKNSCGNNDNDNETMMKKSYVNK
jgi:hypothetical protein